MYNLSKEDHSSGTKRYIYSMSLLGKYNRTDKNVVPTLAEEIAFAILGDVTNRKGWENEWDEFDAEIQEEILQEWVDRIEAIHNSKIKE